ncbi:spermidine synthase [Humibacter antri]
MRVETGWSPYSWRVQDHPSVVLKNSGLRAVIEPDRWVPGSYQLVVDGTPQSHVDLDDPTRLFFEYVQRMGNVIDLLRKPGEPITAVHLGAGAMTLPRYIATTRPGSRQQVIELESELVELVRSELPLPRSAQIRVRHGDAREVVRRLPAGLRGTVDLLIVDIFSGARTPAHVTSVEFYREAVSLLAADGVVLVNVADGPPLSFARGQASTLRSVVEHVAALAETQVLKGKRFGNIVLVGSNAALPLDWLPRLLASGPHPAKAVAGGELRQFVAGAQVVTDATAVASPLPGRSVFQLKG